MVTQGLRFLPNHAPPSLFLGVILKSGVVPVEASAITSAWQGLSLTSPRLFTPGRAQSRIRALLGIPSRCQGISFRDLGPYTNIGRTGGAGVGGYGRRALGSRTHHQSYRPWSYYTCHSMPNSWGRSPGTLLQRKFQPPVLSTGNRQKDRRCSAPLPHLQPHTTASN